MVGDKGGASFDDAAKRLVRLCPAEKNNKKESTKHVDHVCYQIYMHGVGYLNKNGAMESRCSKGPLPASMLEIAETCSGGLAGLDALYWQEAPEPMGVEVMRIDAARWMVVRKIVASRNFDPNGIHVLMRLMFVVLIFVTKNWQSSTCGNTISR